MRPNSRSHRNANDGSWAPIRPNKAPHVGISPLAPSEVLSGHSFVTCALNTQINNSNNISVNRTGQITGSHSINNPEFVRQSDATILERLIPSRLSRYQGRTVPSPLPYRASTSVSRPSRHRLNRLWTSTLSINLAILLVCHLMVPCVHAARPLSPRFRAFYGNSNYKISNADQVNAVEAGERWDFTCPHITIESSGDGRGGSSTSKPDITVRWVHNGRDLLLVNNGDIVLGSATPSLDTRPMSSRLQASKPPSTHADQPDSQDSSYDHQLSSVETPSLSGSPEGGILGNAGLEITSSSRHSIGSRTVLSAVFSDRYVVYYDEVIGDFSLQISSTQTADSGLWECEVTTRPRQRLEPSLKNNGRNPHSGQGKHASRHRHRERGRQRDRQARTQTLKAYKFLDVLGDATGEQLTMTAEPLVSAHPENIPSHTDNGQHQSDRSKPKSYASNSGNSVRNVEHNEHNNDYEFLFHDSSHSGNPVTKSAHRPAHSRNQVVHFESQPQRAVNSLLDHANTHRQIDTIDAHSDSWHNFGDNNRGSSSRTPNHDFGRTFGQEDSTQDGHIFDPNEFDSDMDYSPVSTSYDSQWLDEYSESRNYEIQTIAVSPPSNQGHTGYGQKSTANRAFSIKIASLCVQSAVLIIAYSYVVR